MIGGSCALSRYAEPLSWAGIRTSAITAAIWRSPITPATNRHCPKCQTLRKERWIEARGEDLLPIQYFHVVFTIPLELNHLVSMNRKVMYDLLFRSVSETLMELANDPQHLGARIGAIGILHTWGQNLKDHPHVHCIVTGGGLSPDGYPAARAFSFP